MAANVIYNILAHKPLFGVLVMIKFYSFEKIYN